MLIKRLQGQHEKRNGYYYEFDMHSKPLGMGGMGIVYKGFKIYEVTGNRSIVAIKAMFDGLPTEVYERAEREASIRLKNDNLIEMLGFISEIEIDPFGVQKHKYFVVSEYLQGIVLSDILSGQFKDSEGIEISYAKKLYTNYISDSEKTSIEIIKSILSGILALHDKGYIHRDIDPTNVMVTSEGTIKLIDFGIAKYLRSLGTIDKSLTSTGKFIGKAEFASPELVLGDVRNQGYQTDIYAIGILLYQLLVGKLPFIGSKYEVLQMQLSKKVPIKNINNPALAKIVKKATEKDISNRYSSVAEMRADIDRAMSLKILFPVRNFIKVGVITVLLAASCFVLVYVVNLLLNKSGEYLVAESLELEQTHPSSTQIDYSNDFEIALSKLNSTDKQTANEGLQQMERLAENNYAEAKNVLGITYCTFSKVQSSVVKNRRKVLELNKNVSKDLSLEYLENIKATSAISIDALYVLGYSYWRESKWEKAAEVFQKALDMLSQSTETSYNGFSDSELENNIKHYLNLCNQQIRASKR